jgi:hypothetical protein
MGNPGAFSGLVGPNEPRAEPRPSFLPVDQTHQWARDTGGTPSLHNPRGIGFPVHVPSSRRRLSASLCSTSPARSNLAPSPQGPRAKVDRRANPPATPAPPTTPRPLVAAPPSFRRPG